MLSYHPREKLCQLLQDRFHVCPLGRSGGKLRRNIVSRVSFVSRELIRLSICQLSKTQVKIVIQLTSASSSIPQHRESTTYAGHRGSLRYIIFAISTPDSKLVNAVKNCHGLAMCCTSGFNKRDTNLIIDKYLVRWGFRSCPPDRRSSKRRTGFVVR